MDLPIQIHAGLLRASRAIGKAGTLRNHLNHRAPDLLANRRRPIMQTRHIFAALGFAAAFPALAGTIATTAAAPQMHRIARADNVTTHATTSETGKSAVASDSIRQKNTPPTATGGLLNTDATPAQAKAVTRDTNRKIAQGQITPQVTPPRPRD
jgi:hypothetical protein